MRGLVDDLVQIGHDPSCFGTYLFMECSTIFPSSSVLQIGSNVCTFLPLFPIFFHVAIKTNLRNLTCSGPGSGQDNEAEDRLYDRGVCRPLFGTNQIANRGVSIAALFFFDY